MILEEQLSTCIGHVESLVVVNMGGFSIGHPAISRAGAERIEADGSECPGENQVVLECDQFVTEYVQLDTTPGHSGNLVRHDIAI
jgi:hypothetical protein